MLDEVDEGAEYELVMPFLTDNKEWVEGFECGTLYQKLEDEVTPIEGYFHTSNYLQIQAMAKCFGYLLTEKSKSNEWVSLILVREEWPEIFNEEDNEQFDRNTIR